MCSLPHAANNIRFGSLKNILDLRMTEGENLRLLAGTKLLAISLANDDEAKASAENIGAAKFLDKMNLSRELIPAILELAPKNSGFVS
jgi:hypothetical protein